MKREFFYAKPSKRLIIGDPMYLEDIENNRDTGAEKQLSFIRKRLPKNMVCKIVIEEKEEKYEDFSLKTIYVNIMAVKNTHNIEDIIQMFYILNAIINDIYIFIVPEIEKKKIA